jgi:uncharacterized protein YggE
MAIALTPTIRAAAAGAAAAALLIGTFAIGASRGSAAATTPPSALAGGQPAVGNGAQLTSSPAAARITVTGNGTVSGTPNQLTLGMGVQVNAASVASALQQANATVRRVTAALRARGVAADDIQTTGLYIQPSYSSGSSVPSGYGVSELLTGTLTHLAVAGGQIEAAVRAGGNAATVDNVSLSLADTSGLLATARARAIADARVKAAQYAKALGRPLGPVISVSDQTTAQPLPFYAGVAANSATKSSVPISPGSQQLSISVTVVYALA